MRKTMLIFWLCFIIKAITPMHSSAQGTLIHYWHFNSYPIGAAYTPTITAIPADYTDLPGANARILYAEQPGTSTAYSSFLEGFASLSTDYDTVNLRMSQPAGNYIRCRNPSDSMELLFYTPSTHFHNLVFTFGTSRPANGMIHQNYDYSTDSGMTWTTSGLSMTTDSAWSTFQRITLICSNAAVNNNPKLVFRVTWAGNNTGASGNNRFDNVSLDGDTLTSAGITDSKLITGVECLLSPNPVTDRLNVQTNMERGKTVFITDVLGRKIYESEEQDRQFSVSTAGLKTGCYYMRILENATGNVYVKEFMKQ